MTTETERLIHFINWLNDQTDLILDPVCDLDPHEVVVRYFASRSQVIE